jgi:hypothetical protein
MEPTKKTVSIACSMLRDELEMTLLENDAHVDVVWLEKGLHEKPEKLRRALQEEIDAHQDADVIQLSYCLCGNAVLGLQSGSSVLVIPKFDDCIRLLRSTGQDGKPEVDCRCLYFTRGWIESDKFLLDEIRHYQEKYGARKAARITEGLLGNYAGIRLIDTGAYNAEEYNARLREESARLNLDFGLVPGTRRVLDKLVTGAHDHEFCIIPPGRAVSLDDFFVMPQV